MGAVTRAEEYRELCCDLLCQLEILSRGGVDLEGLSRADFATREYGRLVGRYDEISGCPAEAGDL